jgi:hypothetical protein
MPSKPVFDGEVVYICWGLEVTAEPGRVVCRIDCLDELCESVSTWRGGDGLLPFVLEPRTIWGNR